MNKQLQEKIGKLIGKDYFKLEFGCDTNRGIITSVFESEGRYSYAMTPSSTHWDGTNGEATAKRYSKENLGEILGTEPTLQDVLLAVDSLGGSNCSLRVHTKTITIWDSEDDVNYDLTKSLFNQTDEVKQQLLELMR